jgi:predicted Zn-dependent peptidase
MIKKYTLDNGIRIIEDSMTEAQSFTVLVMFKTGSRNETDNIWGISHFLEHMVFKGTKSFPAPDILAKELDSLGAMYNAFTSKEHTGYYIKGSKRVFERAMSLIAEMTTSPIISEEEVDKERGTIIEEINMYEDNPQRKIYDYFEESLYGNKYVSQVIVGTKDSLVKINSDTIKDYRNKHYRTGNMVIAISGFVPDNFGEIVTDLFDVPEGNTDYLAPIMEPRKKVNLCYKETQQTHLALGFSGLSYVHKDRTTAKLLSMILGGNMSSRMFSEIREKRGLAYYVKTYSDNMADGGCLVTFAGINNDKVIEAVKLILEVYQAVAGSITEEELRRAKDYVIGMLTLQYEDSEYRSETNAAYLLYEIEPKSLDERLIEIEAITLEDVRRVAAEIINPTNATLALIGPFNDEQEFDKILQNSN